MGPRSASVFMRAVAPLGIQRVAETGEILFEPLQRLRTQRHVDKRAYRFYGQYRLPERYGGKEISVRLNGSEEDETRKLNRAEVLRAIPSIDPDFRRIYPRRNDAESIHRALEDSLYLRRAHSVGHRGQEVDLLGFAHVTNCLSSARHRARERLKPAA